VGLADRRGPVGAYAGRRPGVWVLRAGEAPLRVPTIVPLVPEVTAVERSLRSWTQRQSVGDAGHGGG
jgi:hypothetical protein